jgi:histidyl-tRNA synthetase
MARIASGNATGTRDFLPRELVRRNRVFSLLRETFEHHGYEPLETPAVENSAVLEGKYGEEGDRLLFRILKRGESLQKAARTLEAQERDTAPSTASLARTLSDEALRYDLTVPFARVIAAHQNELVLPFRRYQMQPVWRAERPQRGRYREFYQCDVDCVGSRSLTLDAEMVAIHYEVFSKLGFIDFVTKINHRGLLRSLMALGEVPEAKRAETLTAMDKLDKIGPSGVRSELVRLELGEASTDRIMELIDFAGTPETVLARLEDALAGSSGESDGLAAIADLREVFEDVSLMGVPADKVKFDASLVRGLGYYTGPIFETVLTGSQLGSLGGGGRYDQLIGQFTGRDLPCVGISFGIDRVFDALAEQKLEDRHITTTTQALVTVFSRETLAASLGVARELRSLGIRTETSADPKDLGTQLRFADKKGIPLVVILGPDEIAAGAVVLRDLRSGTQSTVPSRQAADRALAILTGGETDHH